jgi:cell wall-associated NlpC family hydrolase
MPASALSAGAPRSARHALLPLLVVAAVVASLFALTPAADAASRRQQRIVTGMDVARHQKGDPYRYGAAGPNAFDCSGLIYYSYRRAGFRHVPRTSSAQAHFMNRIKRSHMRKGDLVFYYSGRAAARNVYHVGVFAGWRHGHRTIVHAPNSGSHVKRERIWTSHWFPGTLRGL